MYKKLLVWNKTTNLLETVLKGAYDANPDNYVKDLDTSALPEAYDARYLTIDLDTRVVTQLTTGTEYDSRANAALDSFKARKLEQIDNITSKKIAAAGFEHPASSGNLFSLSLAAQVKWTGLFTSRDSMSYPLTVPLMDDSGTYDIADAAEVVTMYGAVVQAVNTQLAAGTVAKAQVRAATTKAEVKAIVAAFKSA